jgi:lysophospholipase L1-like esterase
LKKPTPDTVTVQLPANDFRIRSLRHLLVLQALGCKVKANSRTTNQLERMIRADRRAALWAQGKEVDF